MAVERCNTHTLVLGLSKDEPSERSWFDKLTASVDR